MSGSLFSIQVVDKRDGQVVSSFDAGSPVELQLVESLVARVGKKGVGVGRTSKQVLAAVEDAFKELLYDLKAQV